MNNLIFVTICLVGYQIHDIVACPPCPMEDTPCVVDGDCKGKPDRFGREQTCEDAKLVAYSLKISVNAITYNKLAPVWSLQYLAIALRGPGGTMGVPEVPHTIVSCL